MPRLRACYVCPRDDGGSVAWHDTAAWPHEAAEHPRTDPPSLHTDKSFRRAYGPGIAAGLGPGVGFETRAAYRDHLKIHGIAEGAPDTPKRAGPSAVELARKKRLFERAFEKARRGPPC